MIECSKLLTDSLDNNPNYKWKDNLSIEWQAIRYNKQTYADQPELWAFRHTDKLTNYSDDRIQVTTINYWRSSFYDLQNDL